MGAVSASDPPSLPNSPVCPSSLGEPQAGVSCSVSQCHAGVRGDALRNVHSQMNVEVLRLWSLVGAHQVAGASAGSSLAPTLPPPFPERPHHAGFALSRNLLPWTLA